MSRRIDRLYAWKDGETALSVELHDDRLIASIEGVRHEYEILSLDAGLLRMRDEQGNVLRAFLAAADGKVWIQAGGRVHVLERRTQRRRVDGGGRGALGPIAAPMFGTVRKVLVEQGAGVEEGQGLVVIEAMKMELTLRAPAVARVVEICCREGEQVEQGTSLVILAPPEGQVESPTDGTA